MNMIKNRFHLYPPNSGIALIYLYLLNHFNTHRNNESLFLIDLSQKFHLIHVKASMLPTYLLLKCTCENSSEKVLMAVFEKLNSQIKKHNIHDLA